METRRFSYRLDTLAFAFRGYNITNLGRSGDLLREPTCGPIVRKWLAEASASAGDILKRPVDLVERVERGEETSLETYGDAIALIVATELAQIEILREHYGVDYSKARVAFGYSLGEISALVAGGVLEMDGALRILLSLADDCVDLARDVTLGVFFSRGAALPLDTLRRACIELNGEGQGVIGISAYLSPNSVLLMGQGDTLDRFRRRMKSTFPEPVYLRKNQDKWPPMHTPIVWQRHIPNRAADLMHTTKGGLTAPRPPILSLVTGKKSYNDYNCREILSRWVDHPQRLWDVVYETLATGVETIVHVGPQPNIMPSTFKRLTANVEAQTRGSFGMRALSGIVRRPWLSAILPERTALLRAPLIRHVMLEDWLLGKSDEGTLAERGKRKAG